MKQLPRQQADLFSLPIQPTEAIDAVRAEALALLQTLLEEAIKTRPDQNRMESRGVSGNE